MKTNILKLTILTIMAITLSSWNVKASDYKTLVNLAGYWKFNLGDDKSWAEPKTDDKNWDNIRVPSAWENQGYVGYDGYAWYRKKVYVPSVDKDRTIMLIISNIDDVDEVYVNDHLIGHLGLFPPNYLSAYGWERKYYVPLEFVNQDAENSIAIRVYDDGGEGGIVGDKVKLCLDADEEFLNLNLAGDWKFKIFDKKAWKEPDLDDSKWADIKVPGYWESQGYYNYDGYAWYRKSFILPKDLESKKLFLVLGKIDDYDVVYLNGKKIGETSKLEGHHGFFGGDDNWWGNSSDYRLNRIYEMPKDIIKHGKNLIAVRVYDSGQAGGIYEGPIGLMDEDNAGEYGRKHHIDENIFQTIFEFIFE